MKKLLALILAAALALALVACGGDSGAGDTNTPSGGMTKEEMLGEAEVKTFEDLPEVRNMAKAKQEIGKIYRIYQTVSNIEEDYCELCPVTYTGTDSQGRDLYTIDEAKVVCVYLPQETLAQLNFNDTIAIVGEISKEPLKKAHIKRHEGKGRRSRPEFSQFLRPNAGFCPVFLRLSHKKGAKAPVMLPAVFARPSPGSRGLRRQT